MNSTKVHLSPPEDFRFNVSVSACYLTHQSQCLFLKKNSCWMLPAGKLEEGETPKEALLREVKEETGICLLAYLVEKVGKVYIRKPDCDFTLYLFLVKLQERTEVALSCEHTDYDWVLEEDIPKLPLQPGAHEALKLFQKYLRRDFPEKKLLH